MLKSNGNWDNYGRFRDFEVDAIVVDDNASYGILSSTIAEQLSIDTSDKIIEIKYIVNENCPPMEIRNDMGVRAYMETKKENKNLGSYPLCISVRDFNMELAINNESTSAGMFDSTLQRVMVLLCYLQYYDNYLQSSHSTEKDKAMLFSKLST